MALPKLFQRIFWHNNTTPAINEDNLNAMSKGLSDVDDRLISLAGTIQEDVVEIQEDMEILNAALETIDDSVASAQGSASTASAKAIIASNKALIAEGFAVGEQNGTEVGQDSNYYQNNAKYYAEIANPPIENTVDFTDIITVTDAINKAAKDVKVKVEAVQDLHGYDKPWVGGAGKNKLILDATVIKANNTSGSWSGNTYTIANGTITLLTDSDGNVTGIKVNGTFNANVTFLICNFNIYLAAETYIVGFAQNSDTAIGLDNFVGFLSGINGSTSWVSSIMAVASRTFTITDTSQGIRAAIYIGSGTSVSNITLYPMIRKSTDSQTFEPYTNICPITGWDNAKVTRSGKNLCESKIMGNIGGGGGIWNDTSYALGIAKVKKGQTYVYTSDDTSTYVYAFYTDVPALNSISYDGTRTVTTSGVFTAPIDGYIAFRISPSYAYAQCEVGTQATSYESYQGIETTISLNGTRYGGTLDVTSGVLTVTKVYDTIDGTKVVGIATESATDTLGGKRINTSITNAKAVSVNVKADIISDKLPTVTAQELYALTVPDVIAVHDAGGVVLRYMGASTLADAQTALNNDPVNIVYELATPQTIQLTPTQVYLLYGYNTLFGDCGDISLTYDASGIIHIAEAKLDTETLKNIAAASSDFADFKARIAAL